MAENTIDNLSIQVTASAENAARVFDRLASSAGRLRGAAQGAAGGMQDMAQGAQDAGTATQEAGTQSGRARPNIRGVGKDAKDAGENAKKGSSGLATFWQSLKRIAFYRIVRTVLKEITASFKEGITNLYHWSAAVNGHFASSMNNLATSTQYLKNSLGAMVSPLIETLIPVLDVIIDKIVDVLNFFNMLVAAVSGADTYTVAKKTAAIWDDSSDKLRNNVRRTTDELKRTLLGFDEINKLSKQNSSSGNGGYNYKNKQPNYSDMFEEKPLQGIFKKISDITSGWPDWLKALLGVGTAALAIFGIPALLKSIWDWLKKLFSLNIPDFFRWLFGPKGDGNLDLNLPEKIDLPDADIKTNLQKGDWSALDELGEIDDTNLNVSVRKSSTWNEDAWAAANMGGKTIARFIIVSVKKAVTWSEDAWKAANMGGSTVVRFIKVAVTKAATWNKEAWAASNQGSKTVARFINVAVRKAMTWDKDAWKASNMGGSTVARFIDVATRKANTWSEDAWKASNMGGSTVARFIDVAVRKANTWNDNAWNAANMGGNTVARFIDVAVRKAKSWSEDAWKAANMGGSTVARFIDVAVRKAITWNNEAWKAANMDSKTIEITAKINLEKNGWDTITNFFDKNFSGSGSNGLVGDGSIGGGGTSAGGGAGRAGRSYSVKVNAEAGSGMEKIEGNDNLSPIVSDVSTNANVSLKKDGWSYVDSWITNNRYNETPVYQKVGLVKNGWDWVDNWAKQFAQTPINQKVNLVLGNIAGNLSRYISGRAKGGVFSGGHWSDIPQYADGTAGVNHGSLFWAGENGAEIVGNAGGRTEVLNKSQIASAMFSAVQAAMAPAAANFASAAQSMGVAETGFDLETLAEMIRQGVEQAMSRSNDYDRQKVELLRSINDKDFNVDVSTASINKAQSRMNRRAGVTIAPVGT